MRKSYKTRRIRPKTFFLRKSKGRNFSIKKSLHRPTVFLKWGCVISEKKLGQTHVDRKKQVQRVKQSCINVYQKSLLSQPSLIKFKWLALRKSSLKTNAIAIGLVSYFSILIFFQYLINPRSVVVLL